MTTQEGIKQIKENMQLIDNWKKINELIPKDFLKSKINKRSGLASMFSASLELAKDGLIDIMQKNLFDDILIKRSSHIPMRLKNK
tara:strand:- start:3640 stop:3894 length:255 start_codon:yes stop_codon:yes gene_type:complete